MPGPKTLLDEYDAAHCPFCGTYMQLEACWECLGAGGFHDCGEDTCCCLDPDERHDLCETCGGTGEYAVCPAANAHPR